MRSYEEIKEPIDLCDSTGAFNDSQRYWSRKPIINCNIPKKYKFRVKRWNYWTISNRRYFFTVAITNFDYAGVVFVYLVDIENKTISEKYISIPFGKNIDLGKNLNDEFSFSNKEITLSIRVIGEESIIKISVRNFEENNNLEGSITVKNPQECLNLIVPWSKKRFQFTSKQNCLKVGGRVKIGEKIIDFDDGLSLAALDFGRGVWKRRMMWNWLSFSDMIQGRLIGLNLGGKWTDGSGLNENAVFLDGKIYKLKEDVEFIYDPKDLYKKWIIKNEEGTVYLEFHPIVKRYKDVNVLIVKSHFKQFFGKLNGKIIIDNEEIIIDDINSVCEEHKAKW